MSDFLNFSEISSKILFKDVLDWLNIPYSADSNGEIKGEGFIISPTKNLYMNPNGTDKGSVINFLAARKGIDLRSAAKELKDKFLTTPKEPKRDLPILELHYCQFLKDKGISEELAKKLEIGLVKQHSIISGRIGFKTYDETGAHSGYVAYNFQKNEWFFPKGFKRTLYNPHRFDSGEITLVIDIFTCISYLIDNIPCVALIGKSMTDTQAEQLSQFTRVSLVHPEPDNIVVRIARKTFVMVSPE
jgi:hypothetical protein